MIPKHIFNIFIQAFPWYEAHVVKYKGNRIDGGIDITLDSGDIFNFNIDGKTWVLKGANKNGTVI